MVFMHAAETACKKKMVPACRFLYDDIQSYIFKRAGFFNMMEEALFQYISG